MNIVQHNINIYQNIKTVIKYLFYFDMILFDFHDII